MTEEEFLTLADELRPYTEKAMKIEPAPWIKDYMVDMDDLYTELSLEKIDNKPYQQVRRNLENYKELFTFEKSTNVEMGAPPAKLPRRIDRKKILFKGDPGRGKTTLSKKIAWDWAKGLFTSVSIIFFVFLKLVKPGDVIENVNIKQTPALQGLHVTKEKIASIFETFGDHCLLIFDGLDEYAFGQNEDVLKIIKDAKWLRSNVVITSRPHNTNLIEGHCDTIVSVEGFTRTEAEKFASRVVLDQGKVKHILDFNPNRFNERQYLHNIPILLSFLCVLVREDGIDLSDSSISIGEIYWKMVRCLYKKFILRKGKKFERNSFVNVLKSLGKLALETLFKSPFFQRSQVVEAVGEEAFDYGILIGHEDFRLIKDETADILITFPHRSLHEFLGAFYFVLALNTETDMQNFNNASKEFVTNPLFHQFCLWFLDCRQLSEICPSWNRQHVYELLASYAAAQINHVKMDLKDTMGRFPAFEVALKDQNQKALVMLGKVLAKCDKVRDLGLGFRHPAGQTLSSLGPLFKLLRSIQIPEIKSSLEVRVRIAPNYRKEIWHRANELKDCHINPGNDLNVIVRGQRDVSGMSVLADIYKVCKQWKRSPFVYINLPNETKGQFELSELLNGTTKGLHLYGRWKIVCHNEIQLCPMLTHLSLNRLCFRHISNGLSEALKNSKFPQLSHLSLNRCLTGTKGSLSSLFQSKCSSLKHLNLSSCKLEEEDLRFLHSVNTDTDSCVLPNLSSLVLTVWMVESGSLSILFQNPWTKLMEIRFENDFDIPDRDRDLDKFTTVINESKLPNLVALHLNRVVGDLNSLQEEEVPHLNSLTLYKFETRPHEMLLKCLASKVSTWKLEKLDISHNREVGGTLYILASGTLSLPVLSSLIVTDCRLNKGDLWSLGVANEKGRLPELKYLDISDNEEYGVSIPNAGIAGNLSSLLSAEFRLLQGLIVRYCRLIKGDLRSLARANAAGKLPELRHLEISGNDLKGSLKLLTRDPETDRPLSWRSVTCDDVYFSADDEYLSNDDEYLSNDDEYLSNDDEYLSNDDEHFSNDNEYLNNDNEYLDNNDEYLSSYDEYLSDDDASSEN